MYEDICETEMKSDPFYLLWKNVPLVMIVWDQLFRYVHDL